MAADCPLVVVDHFCEDLFDYLAACALKVVLEKLLAIFHDVRLDFLYLEVVLLFSVVIGPDCVDLVPDLLVSDYHEF